MCTLASTEQPTGAATTATLSCNLTELGEDVMVAIQKPSFSITAFLSPGMVVCKQASDQ